MRRATPVVALVVLAMGGCGGDAPGDGGPRAGEAAVVPLARLGPPTAVVGSETEPFEEVVGALLLDDGRMVVADAGAGEVRVYRGDGGRVGSAGGRGDGPAEFGAVGAMGRWNVDTVWVHDWGRQRVVLVEVDSTPAIVEGVPLEPPPPTGRMVGLHPVGGFVVAEAWSSRQVAATREPGLHRAPVALLRHARNGRLVDTLTTVGGREVILWEEGGRGVMSPAPLGRHAVHAVVGSYLVVGDQVDGRLEVISLEGVEIYAVAGGAPPAPAALTFDPGGIEVDENLRAAWRDARLQEVPAGDRPGVERQLAEMPWPLRRPAHGALLASGDTAVWIAEFSLPGEAPPRWRVFDLRTGEERLRVEVPTGFVPLHVDGDAVVGRHVDSLGVHRVERREMVPAGD